MTEKTNPKKLTRREMLRLTAMTGAGLVAAACAPAAPTAAPAAAPEAKPTEAPAAPTAAPAAAKIPLRLVVMDYDEKMKPDTEALVDSWNSSQDKSVVELNVYNWGDGPQKLTTEVSAGQAPDLANNNSQWVGQWNSINEILPLDNLLPKEFLANFVPSGLEAFTIKNQLVAMPYFLDPRAMYYRKDLFDAQGLKAPSTWDDVVAGGLKLHNPPDMTGNGMVFSRASDDLDYWWYAWLGANGADANVSLWEPDGKSRFAAPEAIEATQWLADLNLKHKIVNADVASGGRDGELQPLFYAGKLAMLQTGSWFPTLLKNNAPDLAYSLVTIPVKTAGMKPITGFWPDAVAMFSQSKNKEAAAEFLQYMFNYDNRLLFAKQRGVIPERIDVGASPDYAVSDTEKFFVEQLKTAWNVYETPFPATLPQTNIEAEAQILRAVLGEISAEEAMKNAAAFADKTNGLA
jgi:ABC-type glycerol-3-phosphate transport system substrate-binding protein